MRELGESVDNDPKRTFENSSSPSMSVLPASRPLGAIPCIAASAMWTGQTGPLARPVTA
jgi:hypothetical protein